METRELDEQDDDSTFDSGAKSSLVSTSRRRGKVSNVACWRSRLATKNTRHCTTYVFQTSNQGIFPAGSRILSAKWDAFPIIPYISHRSRQLINCNAQNSVLFLSSILHMQQGKYGTMAIKWHSAQIINERGVYLAEQRAWRFYDGMPKCVFKVIHRKRGNVQRLTAMRRQSGSFART